MQVYEIFINIIHPKSIFFTQHFFFQEICGFKSIREQSDLIGEEIHAIEWRKTTI